MRRLSSHAGTAPRHQAGTDDAPPVRPAVPPTLKPVPSMGKLYLPLPGRWAQPCTLQWAPKGGGDTNHSVPRPRWHRAQAHQQGEGWPRKRLQARNKAVLAGERCSV